MSVSLLQKNRSSVNNNSPISRRDANAVRQQHQLLEQIADRWDVLVGRAARLIVVGQDFPVSQKMYLHEQRPRPLVVIAEIRIDGRILMTGSYARYNAVEHEMRYNRLFQYDIGMPFAESSKGVPAEALVLRKRELVTAALTLLRSFVRDEPTKFIPMPEVGCDSSGYLFEDFSACMGVEIKNPVINCVADISLPNPAHKVFEAHGIDAEDASIAIMADGVAAENILAECKARLGPCAQVVPDSALQEALISGTPMFRFQLPVLDALEHFPEDCVEAVARQLLPWQRSRVTHADLMRACQNPTESLVISGLSKPVVFQGEEFAVSPDYTGDPMPAINYMPASAASAVIVDT
jgi:hypothetical protein